MVIWSSLPGGPYHWGDIIIIIIIIIIIKSILKQYFHTFWDNVITVKRTIMYIPVYYIRICKKKIFISGRSIVVATRTFTTLFVRGTQCLISQIKSALAGLPSVCTWNKIFLRFLFRNARILLQIKQNVDFNQSDGRETWWLTGQQTWRRNIMEVWVSVMWSVNSCSMNGQEMITMYEGGINYLLRSENRFL